MNNTLLPPTVGSLAIGIAIFAFWLHAVQAFGSACQSVLLVNSYSTRFQWSVDISRSVFDTITNGNGCTEVVTEYLDTKRHSSPEYYQSVARMFARKYDDEHFDAIVTTDDNAAKFVLGIRNSLFSGVPVVFCGVNDLNLDRKFDLANTTGVFEQSDISKTVAIAITQNPAVRTIYVINDYTASGEANQIQLHTVMKQFRSKVDFVMLRDFNMKELLERLATLPKDSIVLLLSFARDKSGQAFPFRESMANFRSVCERPVYGMWDFFLGHGIVGGMITSARIQGQKAGKMALRILGGESADSIPMVRNSPNRFMFDYRELKRFGISDSLVPGSGIIVHKPELFWEKYFNLVLVTAIVFVVLCGLVLVLAVTIIARRRAEMELNHMNSTLEGIVHERTEELRQRSLELEGANARLQKMDELKTSLMNTVSHDLRTPLTSILGFALLIRKDLQRFCMGSHGESCELPGMQRVLSNVGIIVKEGDRLSRLINDFLDMSRLEAGHMPWDDRVIDPVKLAADAIEASSGAFEENVNVQLFADISETLPPVMADYDRLRQVLANLIANAHRFTQQGSVTLKVREQDGYVLFSISDTGVGIPDSDLGNVFDKFHQVSDTLQNSAVPKGSGMGLAISKGIVEHYKGRIWADHNPGGGAVVMFTIPAAQT